ncbi:hypothetical protein CKA32_000269 [Geitlerinema sp. FC II]|nr:hypothetical protein CKA32_000355 [Geitlerinema sp. FC II]PPT05638.1 hypothetical protein CKA32_002290 [Geitlerinema sp. FC II]PPT05956.1 hypothetical protein CKA32_003826 [Geitlerinema sp. FC II]PPT06016.1 hypothetical protein CKA32_005480 [Geitlerinema sp. FC II]PPT06326.1 hypothetical protein CKA32_002507 [Geitlerinema sp. FC II]
MFPAYQPFGWLELTTLRIHLHTRVIHTFWLGGFPNRAIRYRLFSSLTTRELPVLQQQEMLSLQEEGG